MKLPHIILWSTGLAMLRRKLLVRTVFLEDLWQHIVLLRGKNFKLTLVKGLHGIELLQILNFKR